MRKLIIIIFLNVYIYSANTQTINPLSVKEKYDDLSEYVINTDSYYNQWFDPAQTDENRVSMLARVS